MRCCGLLLASLVLLRVNSLAWTGEKKADAPKVEESIELVVNDELVNADLKDRVRTECFSKTFKHKMIAGKTYQIDMVGKDIDPFLRIENASGAMLAEDRKGGGKGNARIFYRVPKTEDYDIIATSTNPGMGKFTLTIKELKNVGTPIELKNVAGNADYAGALTAFDAPYKNKKHKLFLFKMEAGKTYQIDMKSKAFDAYLFLEGPDGVLLAQDDDSGGNLNARIIHKATITGIHRIAATYFNEINLGLQGGIIIRMQGRGSSGDFTLTIRQLDEPK
jgi:hypothetical protein